jgi:DNA modification methylase
MSESFLNGKIELHCGDCLAVLPMLAENSVDSCVTDSPYHLTSGNMALDRSSFRTDGKGNPNNGSPTNWTGRKTGFMGKSWDGGDIAFRPEVWREVYRVLKPGAHLLAFGGTRTYHRMACAIEDAGFEIRDTIMWVYGSGFPKSHDVSKSLDGVLGKQAKGFKYKGGDLPTNGGSEFRSDHPNYRPYEPATPAARQWEGWGTALKPACEPIVLARKPLSERTVAANVLRWGTGAINVDGCRVATEETITATRNYLGGAIEPGGMEKEGERIHTRYEQNSNGRWPANVIHDGSEEVVAGFPESDGQNGVVDGQTSERNIYNNGVGPRPRFEPRGDSGSAARFFYTSKADSDDRLGSKHPTVKPLDLMQYLVRLVTPPQGRVLDPFAGTGTTGEAAWREGMRAVLIEREAEYQADIRRRMALVLSGPDERARQGMKERMKGKPADHGPLFGGLDKDERGGGRKIYGVFADERLARSD